MRARQEILAEALDNKAKTPDWDTTASLHERLTLEVLVDIRDQLSALTTILGSVERIAYRAGQTDQSKDRRDPAHET